MSNPYAEVADVQALISSLSMTGLTIGAGSTPTTAQVQDILDQTAAEVNGILYAAGYGTVPADGANDLLLIGLHVSQKSAARTYHAGYGGFGDTPARVEQWEKEWDAFLERLETKTMRLVDQAPGSRVSVVKLARYIED